MARETLRGILGGCAAALLLIAPAAAAPASTAPAHDEATPTAHAKTAAKPAKPPVKTAAKKSVRHAATHVAAAKQKPPVKKLAAAKKPEPKKLAAVKKLAKAKKPEEAKLAATAPPKPVGPPSYTVTTMEDGVTMTETRIVPPAAAPAAMSIAMAAPAPAPAPPAEKKPVAVPASLVTPDETATLPGPDTRSAATTPWDAATAIVANKAATPGGSKPAAGFVSRFLTEAFLIAKESGATSLQRRAQLADLFARKMDVKHIAGYTTANELADTSADIQQRFRTILVSYLVETYYPQLELASDPGVRVETTPATPLADGTAVVWTTFTKDGWGSQAVKWHLKLEEDGSYRIVDIFSAGASVVQMERDTFASVMRNGGLSELMAKLDQRTKELASAATE